MGWGPCLTHSAPLLLPYIGATKRHWKDGLKLGAVFSGGRLVALGFLGGAATVAFSHINQFFPPHRSGWLYGIVALFMISMGILIVAGKGLGIRTGTSILNKGSESMFVFGLLMGIAPCVPYVAILTYIACVAENEVLKGVWYAVIFATGTAIAPIVLASLTSIIPERLLSSARLLRGFQVLCGIVLIVFGVRLLYFVLYVIK
jgi:threonine/homoserine/homoserine lactone efflux protein